MKILEFYYFSVKMDVISYYYDATALNFVTKI